MYKLLTFEKQIDKIIRKKEKQWRIIGNKIRNRRYKIADFGIETWWFVEITGRVHTGKIHAVRALPRVFSKGDKNVKIYENPIAKGMAFWYNDR